LGGTYTAGVTLIDNIPTCELPSFEFDPRTRRFVEDQVPESPRTPPIQHLRNAQQQSSAQQQQTVETRPNPNKY
jgi:hypothetical protein